MIDTGNSTQVILGAHQSPPVDVLGGEGRNAHRHILDALLALADFLGQFEAFDFLDAAGNLMVIFSDGEDTHAVVEGKSLDDIVKMLNDPAIVYTTTPNNVMKYVAFMNKIVSIKVRPDSWKDLFFPNAQNLPGS